MSQEKMPIGVWIRVSDADAVMGESPAVHKSRALDYAAKRGYEVVEIYQLDAISGKTVIERPEAKQMMRDVRSGRIKGLLFSRLDRVGRNALELMLIEKFLTEHGTRLLSIFEDIDTSTPDGMRRFIDLAAQAQYERQRLSARIKAGLRQRAKMGQVTTANIPYGFKKVDRALEIHPIESTVRVLAFDLFLEHQRLKVVASILNDRGYRTRNKGLWTNVSVKYILEDSSAIGKYIVSRFEVGKKMKPQDEWIEIDVPEIVPVEKWEKAQTILKRNKLLQPAKRPKMSYSGLLYCHCGTKMYYRKEKQVRNSLIKARYFCRDCGSKSGASIRFDDLDQAIGEVIQGFAIDKLQTDFELDDIDPRQSQINAIKSELAHIKKSKDALFELASIINKADFQSRYEPLNQREAELNAERNRIETELEIETEQKESAVQTLSALKNINWCDIEPGLKGDILKTFLKRVTITPEAIDLIPIYIPPTLILDENLCKGYDSAESVRPITQNIKFVVRRVDVRFEPHDKRAWGYHVAKVRKDRGLTTQACADMIGCSRSALTHWECFETAPATKFIPAIVEFLGFVPWSRAPYQATCGESLAAARELKGITQAQLAKLAGINACTVFKAEANGNVDGFVIEDMCLALKIPNLLNA